MKTTLFLFCLFCAGAAFGQSTTGYGALSNEPQVLQMPSHPQHAAQRPMAAEQSLLETSVPLYARGQRPYGTSPSHLKRFPLAIQHVPCRNKAVLRRKPGAFVKIGLR